MVVGPKGATIKRIQQQTHTYIVTPSRDKEPVFDVTGLPENVEAARKEIEAHIALRTGSEPGANIGNIYGIGENSSNGGGDFGVNGFSSAFSSSNGHLSSDSDQGKNKFNSILTDSAFSSLSSSSNSKPAGITIQNILDSNNFGDLNGMGIGQRGSGSGSGIAGMTAWSNGSDSHDSGIGNSPPFETNGQHTSLESSLGSRLLNGGVSGGTTGGGNGSTGIWGELNKVLGNLDLNGGGQNSNSMMMNNSSGGLIGDACPGGSSSSAFPKSFLNVGSRSSLDLGSLARPSANNFVSGSNGSSNHGSSSSASSNHTATPPNPLLLSSGDASPPNSLPYGSGAKFGGGAIGSHRASVSSEPNGMYETAVDLTASEAAATAAAAELAAFSSSIVLQEKSNGDDVALDGRASSGSA